MVSKMGVERGQNLREHDGRKVSIRSRIVEGTEMRVGGVCRRSREC